MIAIVISVLAAIPVGIGVNLVTPWVKNKLSAHSQTRREARIARIQHDYLMTMAFRREKHTNKLIARVAIWMVYLCSSLGLGIFALILSLYAFTEYGLGNNLAFRSITGTDRLQGTILAISAGAASVVSLAVMGFSFLSITRLLFRVLFSEDKYKLATERVLRKLGSSLPKVEEPEEVKPPAPAQEPAAAMESNLDKPIGLSNQAELGEAHSNSVEPS
jgi:hypothetical protein